MVEKEDLSPSKETPENKKESDEEPLLSKVVDPLELQEAAEIETTEVKAETPVREQLLNQKETAEIFDQKTNIESSEPYHDVSATETESVNEVEDKSEGQT